MAFILRIDVDKPYGRATPLQKVLSKAKEDFWFPATKALGYGCAAKDFATMLFDHSVRGVFSFRLCSLPIGPQPEEYVAQNHLVGLHAENTRSEQTFLEEVDQFKKALDIPRVDFFTKHGSGQLKLGRNHYAPYEESKYREWGEKHQIGFPFGNGAISDNDPAEGDFYPDMFWLNHAYRDVAKYPLEWAIEKAQNTTLIVLVHPENYFAVSTVRADFDRLLMLSQQHGIPWEVTPGS